MDNYSNYCQAMVTCDVMMIVQLLFLFAFRRNVSFYVINIDHICCILGMIIFQWTNNITTVAQII